MKYIPKRPVTPSSLSLLEKAISQICFLPPRKGRRNAVGKQNKKSAPTFPRAFEIVLPFYFSGKIGAFLFLPPFLPFRFLPPLSSFRQAFIYHNRAHPPLSLNNRVLQINYCTGHDCSVLVRIFFRTICQGIPLPAPGFSHSCRDEERRGRRIFARKKWRGTQFSHSRAHIFPFLSPTPTGPPSVLLCTLYV